MTASQNTAALCSYVGNGQVVIVQYQSTAAMGQTQGLAGLINGIKIGGSQFYQRTLALTQAASVLFVRKLSLARTQQRSQAQAASFAKIVGLKRLFSKAQAQSPLFGRLLGLKRALARTQAQAAAMKRQLLLLRKVTIQQAAAGVINGIKIGGSQFFQRTLAGTQASTTSIMRKISKKIDFALGPYYYRQK